jgi:uncharacterized membrane protein YbaN (DUF454 family)
MARKHSLRASWDILAGVFLMALGVLGLALPVLPGLIFLIPGLVLLARHFHWAKRLLALARRKSARDTKNGSRV